MPKTKYPIFKCLHRGQKGFTLLELLIVIAILGVTAAVVIPNITKFRSAGNVEAANAELDSVRTATQIFAIDTGYTCTAVTADNLGKTGCPYVDYLEGVTKCKYTVGTDCKVTGEATCSGLDNVVWDGTNERWKSST